MIDRLTWNLEVYAEEGRLAQPRISESYSLNEINQARRWHLKEVIDKGKSLEEALNNPGYNSKRRLKLERILYTLIDHSARGEDIDKIYQLDIMVQGISRQRRWSVNAKYRYNYG